MKIERSKENFSDMKQKIVVIVGPTAVGKTAFSIKVAEAFGGEVISGDSMQVYKELNIGTAKVTPVEKGEVPHHLIDFKEIDEDYDVSDFQKDATQKIEDITKRNKLPVIAGGTGLYIESLLYPVSHGSDAEPNLTLRKELEEFAQAKGNNALWDRLNKIDSKAADKIHPNNVRRVIRALEVFYETGEFFSSFQNEKKNKEPNYDAFIVCLDTDRQLLYDRINYRVGLMMEEGLEKEARQLWERLGPEPKAQSAKGIGYSEFFPYFNNDITIEEAIEQVKQNSRRYAKRQLTWFRNRLDNVHQYDFVTKPGDMMHCLEEIKRFLEDE